MAVRIIKAGSSLSGAVRPVTFEEQAADPAGVQKIPEWMTTLDASSRIEVPCRTTAPEPSSQAADVAEIEKSAYESGFRQGERAGAEIAEKKLEVVMRRYSDAIFEMGKLKSKLYSEVERQVVKLAIEVAKKVVHREVRADPEVIQTLVRVALARAAENSPVTVRLNPTDYNHLLEHRSELDPDGSGREIVLLADKSIERGGCLVQTGSGDVDARISEEFRELERGFFEGAGSNRCAGALT